MIVRFLQIENFDLMPTHRLCSNYFSCLVEEFEPYSIN